MSPERYLRRIGYAGPLAPTAEALRNLHRAHMFSVPFENLDIPAKRPIVLETERLLHKVVDLHRGGFCYELNGTFAWLLQRLDFEVTMLSACVARRDATFGPDFDHLALQVIDRDQNCWLADVGFGDSFVEPVSLNNSSESEQFGWTYRVLQDADQFFLQRKSDDSDWTSQYRFTLTPRSLDEFAPMCHYHQTSPESSFTQRRFCSLARPDGRITLEGLRLIMTSNGQKSEMPIADEKEFRSLLHERFGTDIS